MKLVLGQTDCEGDDKVNVGFIVRRFTDIVELPVQPTLSAVTAYSILANWACVGTWVAVLGVGSCKVKEGAGKGGIAVNV